MPFNWRRLIPYGIGSLIPNPAPIPAAPPAAPSGAPTGWQQYSGNPAPVVPAYTPNWGQTGGNPDAGMSAFGSSTGPNVSTTNAPAPSYTVGNPLAVSGNSTSFNPFSGVGSAIQGAFAPGGSFGDAPGGGRPNTGAYGGAFGGTPAWGAQGVADAASAQNPGGGALAVDLGQAPKVAQLGGHAL